MVRRANEEPVRGQLCGYRTCKPESSAICQEEERERERETERERERDTERERESEQERERERETGSVRERETEPFQETRWYTKMDIGTVTTITRTDGTKRYGLRLQGLTYRF